jgi:hypothetical protein
MKAIWPHAYARITLPIIVFRRNQMSRKSAVRTAVLLIRFLELINMHFSLIY